MPYKATQKVGLPVMVTCEHCGGGYTYKHPISLNTKANTREEAIQLVEQEVFEAMRLRRDIIDQGDFDNRDWWLWTDGLGYVRCPKCGYMQSWQVKVCKAQRTAFITIIITFLAGMGIILSFVSNPDYLGNDWLPKAVAGFVAALFVAPFIFGIVGVVVLGLMLMLSRPNRKFQPVSTVHKPVLVTAPAASAQPRPKY